MYKNCPRCGKILFKDKKEVDYYYCFLCAMEGSYKELENFAEELAIRKAFSYLAR